MGNLWPLLILVVILAIAAGALGNKKRNRKADRGKSVFPYRVREHLLTPAEGAFYRSLMCVTAALDLDVFAKVRLEDIIEVERRVVGKATQGHRNRIKSRHIDFLLCDTQRYVPILAIELDDKSHDRQERQERDEFIEKALDAAGVPLLRVPVRGAYSDLAEQVRAKLGIPAAQRALEQEVQESTPGNHLASGQAAKPSVIACADGNASVNDFPTFSGADAPKCPHCGSPLVRRHHRQTGQAFLACPKYPACRHVQLFASTVRTGTCDQGQS